MSIKLDLGAGDVVPEGYTPMGRGHYGTEIYPLPYEDNTVDVIRAVHVLEHFGHREVDAVLAEWVRVLKPGGLLRIAVPDFKHIATEYTKGAIRSVPDEWLVMGGQTDENDFHKSIFDADSLRMRFAAAGLVLHRPWTSEIEDCAGYKLSLNLEGTKPACAEMKVCAVMSVPRLAWMDNMNCAFESFVPLGIRLRRCGGAFWGHALTGAIEQTIEVDKPDAIIVCDYDTIYSKVQVARLIETLMAHPEADAIACMQSSRHLPTALFTVQDEDGKAMSRVAMEKFEPDLQPITTAAFGLTIIRTSALAAMKRPWFHATPDADGSWADYTSKIDEDIQFWIGFKEAGKGLFLANHILIGHIEIMVRWPGQDLQAVYQEVRDWNKNNVPPDEAWQV